MRVNKIVVGQLGVNCFIVSGGSAEAMVIDTRVLCGHGEETTLGFEREHNAFLAGRI